jgi:biotin transporter BioY
MLRSAILFSVPSLAGMILIDRWLGPVAGFLNAWSVVERLAGRSPSAGVSVIAQRTGAAGEFVIVIVANAAIGWLLAPMFRFLGRMMG